MLYGGSGGLSTTGSQAWNQDSSGIAGVSEPGDFFGSALACGDFNGDAYADLAIAVSGEDIGSVRDAGAVAILYGSPSSLVSSGNQLWHQNQPGVQGVVEPGDRFGGGSPLGSAGGSEAGSQAGEPCTSAGKEPDTPTPLPPTATNTPTSAPGTPTDTPTPRPPTNTPTDTPQGDGPQSEVKFSIDGASIFAGGTAKVTLRVESAAPGIGAYTVDVSYSQAVVDVTECVPHLSGICNEDLAPGTIRVTGVSVGGLISEVLLASITFGAAAGAEGCSDILLDVVEATGPDGSGLATAANDGEICVEHTDLFRGDVDCSGAIGAVDALLILQYIGGIIDSLPCENNGDANGDGRISSVDAALILQINAGLIDSLPAGTP